MAKSSVSSFRLLFVKITALLLVISFACSLCSCTNDNSDFDGKRFSKTRKISVLVDTSISGDSDLTVGTSAVARYIHDRVLEECNIDVSFVEAYKLYLHDGIAADISYSDNYNEITAYYRMGAVINLAPYLDEYSDVLSDLTGVLGNDNISFCNDASGEIWYLNAADDHPDQRVTFIRSDWLDKLGLEAPSDIDELHECLTAFRDNADLLLGDDADEMIPFFIDSEPYVSAKPLFDSCLDVEISEREFFCNGYSRALQEGYSDGLKILNDWYLDGLLPGDFAAIRPLTKESYEPIEKGYVGAFCAKYDYLYANGDNSHINALHELCGEDADYIAVNTFADSHGDYISWQEDYLGEEETKIFMPSACSEPLACLVYLNWISNPDNIADIQALVTNDPYTFDRYLITCREMYSDDVIGVADFSTELTGDAATFESARQTALEVRYLHHGNMCMRYDPDVFQYIKGDTDYTGIFPDSEKRYVCSVISAGAGKFDTVLAEQYEIYKNSGAEILYRARDEEWEKVMVHGYRNPRPI